MKRGGGGGQIGNVDTCAESGKSAFFDLHKWLIYADRTFRGIHSALSFADWLKSPYIDRDGRVRFNKIGLDVCGASNNGCERCTHFSPFRRAIHPTEDLINSLMHWGERIAPRELSILGSEPFLHPGLAEIIIAARDAFSASKIVITTNATSLPLVDDVMLQTLKESQASLHISVHLDTKEYQDNLIFAIQRLQQFRIKYHIEHCTAPGSLYMIYGLDDEGEGIPDDSDPVKAWDACFRRGCGKIIGHQLYRCGTIGDIVGASHEGAIGSKWRNQALTHKPATLDHTPREILEYLRGEEMPECSVCPETIGTVESRLMSVEDVRQIKTYIIEERQTKD